MSDTLIFMVGLFVFLLLAGGLTFTVLEVRRIERAAEEKLQANKPGATFI